MRGKGFFGKKSPPPHPHPLKLLNKNNRGIRLASLLRGLFTKHIKFHAGIAAVIPAKAGIQHKNELLFLLKQLTGLAACRNTCKI